MNWTQSNGNVEVYTTREGALSAIGHDLLLDVGTFEVVLDGNDVTAQIDSSSLKVAGTVGANGDVSRPGLSKFERGKVEKSIVKDVLHAKKHPTIRFEGTFDPESGQVTGELSLHGKSHSLAIDVANDGGAFRGDVVLHQPDFGIQPYKAFMGALKVAADVTVRFELPRE
jgi:polyisoprenoid-binding protein YceI